MLTAALLLTLTQTDAINISAADPHIRYVGRWDFRDSKGPRAQWSASTVEIRFKGKSLGVSFAGSPDYWVEELDGKPVGKLQFSDSTPQVLVDSPKAAVHTVRLIKATEAFVGIFLCVSSLQFTDNNPDCPDCNSTKE